MPYVKFGVRSLENCKMIVCFIKIRRTECHILESSTNFCPCSPYLLSNMDENSGTRHPHMMLFGLCKSRKIQHWEGTILVTSVSSIPFTHVTWKRMTIWKQWTS